ncbi:alpha/beta fold hydrolase [Achromobacter aegrifaciens]|uniref:alpha/beta fold hydrolase n=2 Tax=Achromobacter aegrifaciens TaxID=1287736 RepID=UPI0014665644|nr:alpha/beta fold hydrolase [Achromobacter aegrifaciens]CAB3648303.1 Homoserine O-acetyltransferase [Achromobacter aegrifaciens]
MSTRQPSGRAGGVTQLDALPLDGGGTLAPVRLAWARYGPPPERARAVVLLLHGISGSHQALLAAEGEVHPDAGWASPWLGSGAALDTRDTCVLAPNALGSCFGSSAPIGAAASAFPDISIADGVRLQGEWLRAIGVERLDAVVGYSYGGYQAFQWAVAAPLPVGRVVALASAPRGGGSMADAQRLRRIAAALDAGDAHAWNEWVELRCATLRRYGYAQWLADAGEPAAEQRLRAEAQAWAARFSPWSMAALRTSACRYDVRDALLETATPVRWLRCVSDELFAPDDPGAGARIAYPAHIVQTSVAGRYGHLSPLLEGRLWDAQLRQALA